MTDQSQLTLSEVLDNSSDSPTTVNPESATADNETQNGGESALNSKYAIPPKCLSFNISGPFAHFRKVETSQTRLTYALPPRTTLNGLIAAILGLDSNSYYDTFSLHKSAIAVSVEEPLRDYSLPVNHQNTDGTGISTVGTSVYKLKMGVVDQDGGTQRVNHNVLRNPVYRVFVWMSDGELYEQLKTKLSNGESHYTPSLGLSEFLAEISYQGEFEPEAVDSDQPVGIDSAVPAGAGAVHTPSDASVTSERSPGEMERIETPLPSRRTTEFLTRFFREDGGCLPVKTEYAASVGDRTVIFC